MIGFVILHYQAIDETNDCINSIQEMVSGEKYIVIVDNCSPNGSGKKLEEQYRGSENVKIILVKDNLGFAKGNNIGFEEAKKRKPDFIVVMNNDVLIKQLDFTNCIKNSYEKYHFHIMGPDIYSTKVKGHQNPQRLTNYSFDELENTKRKLEFKNNHKWIIRLKYLLPIIKKEKRGAELVDKVLENVVLHGACYIFSKDYIDKHDQCFYNETFMYFESYILHYLAQKEGLKMIYDPSIKVLHHEDVATNRTYSNMYNKVIFVNKCLLESCCTYLNILKNDGVSRLK